jgi:hypothetical protein
MDPASLALIVTGVISRVLPYLVKMGGAMGDSLAEETGRQFGPESWETAKIIWSKIMDKLFSKSESTIAVEDVVKSPEDPDNVASLRKEIRKLLEEDQSLAIDLEETVNNRIKVDMNLGEIVKSTVTGVKLKGKASVIDLKMKTGDIKEGSTVTGVDIENI